MWSDIAIEQVLMRDMKSISRGISPSTIATWVHSMPAYSRIVDSVEEFAGVVSTSSEQHVDLRESRQHHYAKDVQRFTHWFQSVTVHNKSVCNNPNQLFHIIMCTLSEIFEIKLSAYPSSLFYKGLMRKGTKSSIVRFLSTTPTQPTANSASTQSVSYVVVGGHLLNRVVWHRPASFKGIFQQYTAHVTTHYSQDHVVFDGYGGGSSTKDEQHLRRLGKACPMYLAAKDSMYVTLAQTEILSNNYKKLRLISLVSHHLQSAGCKVLHAHADADVLIDNNYCRDQKGLETVLIGEDKYLLNFLVALAPPNIFLEMIMPGTKTSPYKIHHIGAIQEKK
ncbi:hypothetical protein PR048_024802 [Dryococelus australis]|uniref:Uncharacterized protein n=1 Tax=Dryococelus australis TaxID=614101 RepID=A0ABQ9GPI7_9NEOP|nr:hypothetical protein PR048_024802 [Dryococelus australis]